MTAPPPDPEDDDGGLVLVPPRGLVPAILAVTALLAAAAVSWPMELPGRARADLSLHAWQLDVEERAAWRDRLLRDHAPLPQEATIVAGWRAWLAREAALGQSVTDDAAARMLRGGVEEQVRALASAHGQEPVVAMVMREAAGLRGAVATAVLTELGGGDSASAWRDVEVRAPGFAALARRLGLAAEVARQAPGELQLSLPAALLVEGLAAERMLSLAARLPPPQPELPFAWQRALLAARVEREHGGLDLARRLELLDAWGELDPTAERTFTLGVLFARAGRYRAAQAAFLAAATAGERPRAARANARWCRQRAGR